MAFFSSPPVPGAPMCPRRWETASVTSLAVNWTTPAEPNGIITNYYIQLLSYDNSTVISEAAIADISTLRAELRGFLLGEFLNFTINLSTLNQKTSLSTIAPPMIVLFPPLSQLRVFLIMFMFLLKMELETAHLVQSLTLAMKPVS